MFYTTPGKKILCTLRNCVPENFRGTVLNSLVISYLQYPTALLCSVPQNLLTTLEKQLNLAVKACYSRRKIDLSHFLKLFNDKLPVRL